MLTFTLDTINRTAQELLNALGSNRCIALHGDMGAGKTTFTRALCAALGAIDAVSSPTFAIVNEYQCKHAVFSTIAHMDWYRLHDAQQIADAGITEYFDAPHTLCIIEWPERAMEILPVQTVHATISISSEYERKLVWLAQR
ncbi:MAG: tRNA ((37)-N6)-threonylcarbamoyltransferase complex ATPase subunit type 1 TsaE [Bacteroidota bacterium]